MINIKDLENRKYLVYLRNEQEYHLLRKLIKGTTLILTNLWHGHYCYNLSEGTYSCNSYKDKSGSYGDGYTIITVNDIIEMNKNIAGYRCPYDLFNGRIKKGEIFSEYSEGKLVMYNKNHMTSGIPVEIVHTWEVAYHPLFVTIGSYTSEKLSNGDIKFGCTTFTKEQILGFLTLVEKGGKITIRDTEITASLINEILAL